jgi:type IV pilus assembly protein PilA
MARRARRHSGFTLIELTIVIAIVGVLAAIAIPQYMRFQLKSKTAEAKSSLAAIRAAEAAHYAEFTAYVAAGQTPASIPGDAPVAFSPATAGFVELGFQPEGRVFFALAVAVSADGTGYTAEAAGDLDADGTPQYWAYPAPASDGNIVPGPIGCDVGNLAPHHIGPCGSDHGQSVF